MRRAGVHCSVRNGFVAALNEAAALKCDTLQIFTQSPRGWRTRIYSEEEFSAFRGERERLALDPVVVHAPYLPNLCTSDEPLYRRSVNALKSDLSRCEKLAADFLVIHPGAYSPAADRETGLNRVGEAINEALAAAPGSTTVLIENMAGGGRRLGASWKDLSEMMKRVKNKKRIGICFDTCHAFAAGYDLSNARGVAAALGEFDREIGVELIRVFHVNDSKDALGSRRDRHENIGAGNVGENGLKILFRSGPFKNCAYILETPKQPAPAADLENLRRLRALLPHD